MIYEHTIDQLLDGSKAQTTRLAEPGDVAINVLGNPYKPANEMYVPIREVRNAAGNLRWVVGQVKAIQAKRGYPGLWESPEGYIVGKPGDWSLFAVAYSHTGEVANDLDRAKALLRQVGFKPLLVRILRINPVDVRRYVTSPEDLKREGFAHKPRSFFEVWTKMHDKFMYKQIQAYNALQVVTLDARPNEYYAGWRIQLEVFRGM